MAEAFVVGGVRTPIGRYGGSLAGVRPDDLAGDVLQGISRDDADAFALRSHQRALPATAAGRFEPAVVAVPTSRGAFAAVETV